MWPCSLKPAFLLMTTGERLFYLKNKSSYVNMYERNYSTMTSVTFF